MKEQYRQFCESNDSVPIFLQPWWLDAVCGEEHWSAVMVEKGGSVAGILPFFSTKKAVFRGIGMPPFTPFMGWRIFPSAGQKAIGRLSFEMEVAAELLEQLPNTAFFTQHLPPDLTNWLPALWLKYSQTTRYTCLLPDITDTGAVFLGLGSNAKGHVRKASNLVQVSEETDPDVLFCLLKKTFERKRLQTPYRLKQLKNLMQACATKNCGRLYAATDDKQQVHAAAYIVRDGDKAYNLLRGSDERLRPSGAMSLVLWKAIQDASAQGVRSFDFVGSVIQEVERFLRSFGVVQAPYFQISKENSMLFFWLRRFKDFQNRFLEK